jgi:flagellar hook assembly protein FlgD
MTEISFSLPVEAHTDLKVFDASGRLIRTLENGVLGAGSHVSMWDGRDNAGRTVTAGIYFYKLNAADKQAVKKVVLMR